MRLFHGTFRRTLERVSGWWQIHENTELRTLAFPALIGVDSPSITQNPRLPACAVEQVFARFAGQRHYQEGNDTTATCP